MTTRIEGPIDVSVLPGLHLTLGNVHIGEPGQELVEAERVKLRIAVLPLLVGKFQILSIELEQPNILVVRDLTANSIAKILHNVEETLDVQGVREVSFSGATLKYLDNQAQASLSAADCNMQMEQLPLTQGPEVTLLQNLSFNAELTCGEFEYNSYSGSDLKILAVATDGVINLAPVTMQFLGGLGTGDIQADFSNASSQYRVHYVLPELKLQSLLNTLPSAFAATGSLDLNLNLALQGNNTSELMRSAKGSIILHGTQLTLLGIDLDEKFEQFEFSQNFDVVDAGAFFFAGPLGLLAKKGYDFTSLLAQSNGSSEITSLISEWTIEGGVAEATDVAMATKQNRIAMQGQLDLVNARFVDVIIALVDNDGCSLIQQKIQGSFTEPQVDKSQILFSIAGPVLNLLQQGAALFIGESCEAFYNGNVTVPK